MMQVAFDRPYQNILSPESRILRVRLRPDPTTATRPVEVAVMLDASSSMRGGKFDRAVDACRHIARLLRSDDRLSLGIFHGAAVTVVEAVAGRDAGARLDRALAGIATGYGSRIDLALDWLARVTAVPGAAARLAVLITDGYPYDAARRPVADFAGLRRQAEALAGQGVTLTAIGLGPAADFHSGLLLDLCRAGGGGFLQAETADSLGDRLAQSLRPAQAVVETAAHLTLDPVLPGLGLDGVCRIRPLYQGLHAQRKGAGWTVALGEIAAGTNDFLLRLSVPAPGPAQAQGPKPVAALRVRIGDDVYEVTPELHFTRDYRLAVKTHDGVERARLLWILDEKVHALGRSDDPRRTMDLAREIEDLAGKTGRDDVKNEAAELRRRYQRDGIDSDAGRSGVLRAARKPLNDVEGCEA